MRLVRGDRITVVGVSSGLLVKNDPFQTRSRTYLDPLTRIARCQKILERAGDQECLKQHRGQQEG